MVAAFAVGTAFLLLFVALAWSQATLDSAVGTLVLSVGLWFIWAAGWWTKVVVSDRGVTVDNVFIRHVVSWSALRGFSLDGGLSATLADGTQLGIVSFGGSLAGAVTQYRGLLKAEAALDAACDRYRSAAASPADSYRRLVKPHWIPLLAYVVPLLGIAL
jgi:hypothetical protein